MRLAVLAIALLLPPIAQAQEQPQRERTFIVRLPESDWNNLARMLSKMKSSEWSWEDVNRIISGIGRDIDMQLVQEHQTRTQSQRASEELVALRAEIERLKTELKDMKTPPTVQGQGLPPAEPKETPQ